MATGDRDRPHGNFGVHVLPAAPAPVRAMQWPGCPIPPLEDRVDKGCQRRTLGEDQ